MTASSKEERAANRLPGYGKHRDLAQDEREAILAIQADTLSIFAQELWSWMKQRNT